IETIHVACDGRLRHSITNHLAPAEFHLVSIAATFSNPIAFDLNENLGVCQTDSIADGRAEGTGVVLAGLLHENVAKARRSPGCLDHKQFACRRTQLRKSHACRPARSALPCRPEYRVESPARNRAQS